MLPAKSVLLLQRQPLLRGFLALGAGYYPKAAGHYRRREEGADHAVFIYCAKGRGWYEPSAGEHVQIGAGDFFALPPGMAHAYGAEEREPWTIHWAHATGALVPEYVLKLAAPPKSPVIRLGEDLQVTLLFNEVLKHLAQGPAFAHVLRASHALAHLLASVIARTRSTPEQGMEVFQKIGQCIEYMSDHVDEPLKVAELASLANLSPAHFSVVFKEHTGTTPRDYLHLLRMHRASEWLTHTRWRLKEIADKLGYRDQFHFSRKFKAFSGHSPSEYRERR